MTPSMPVRMQAAFVETLLEEVAHYGARDGRAASLREQIVDEARRLARLLDDVEGTSSHRASSAPSASAAHPLRVDAAAGAPSRD